MSEFVQKQGIKLSTCVQRCHKISKIDVSKCVFWVLCKLWSVLLLEPMVLELESYIGDKSYMGYYQVRESIQFCIHFSIESQGLYLMISYQIFIFYARGMPQTVPSMTVSISLFPNDIEIFRLYRYLVNFECRGLFFLTRKNMLVDNSLLKNLYIRACS